VPNRERLDAGFAGWAWKQGSSASPALLERQLVIIFAQRERGRQQSSASSFACLANPSSAKSAKVPAASRASNCNAPFAVPVRVASYPSVLTLVLFP